MRQSIGTSLLSLLVGANLVLAACEHYSYTSCDDGIIHWYDLNDGQICDPKDCGGGRAPPRTDVPGCPLYSGTILSEPISYLSCFTPSNAVPLTSSTAAGVAETTADVVITSAVSTSEAGRTTQEPASETSAAESTVAPAKPSTLITTSASSPASASTKTPITSPATLSTKSQATHAASNTTTSATTSSTPNAGNTMGGSLLAVAGVAIGAFVML
ncbi:hypothetical protein BBK36DRAFT_1165036 [Trichoderma citrinoviride]|uniref:Siderophore biosynthesis enzyme n=1 Tax=Trichoderma citrinoviride TaxID=58853 RepID=A0A2T4BMK2_9HYPO|nr:hypothetical protein BBK36DRAFT_1165036 [Trichoderma citrinoviride]PTB70511.1 hypothetical protein BBK36DRAFT_1165036 [Trichoderma citrinoviride]